MGLTLLAGPANSGKVELLLERYLAVLDREPVLIVPNASDIAEREHDLLRRSGALLGGTIGTFDDLFERIAREGLGARKAIADSQRALLIRRVVAGTPMNGLTASARTPGFADALASAIAELELGLLEPDVLEAHLAALYRGYRASLEELGVWDRDLRRVYAAKRIENDLGAWDGRPVFAYGFEDLTAAEWQLIRALAGRAEVTVSLPYEPGRAAFASLARTADDLQRLASGRIEELPPRYAEYAHPALAHLERALFADSPPETEPVPLDGAIRWLEGAGTRATLERVGDEILRLIRSGTDPDEIAVVCPSLDRIRAPIETAFATLGVPYALEGRIRLGQTAFGHALVSLLGYEWREGGRRELYSFLRSPYSGLARHHVDFLEGRLRGRAIDAHDRVEEETQSLRGQPIPLLERFRSIEPPIDAVRKLAEAMLRAAYGLENPPVADGARIDLRAYEAIARVLAELDEWGRLSGAAVSRDDVLDALTRTQVQLSRGVEPGKVAVLDVLRARTRQFDVVFVLGLEEGSLPRPGTPSPFLDDDVRRAHEPEARLVRPDQASRDRYLFYTACTRARRKLLLVREAATDDGSPREPSPFWEETRNAFAAEDVAHATERRRLSQLTWDLYDAPTERERLRSLLMLWSRDDERPFAEALARANDWTRKIDRARGAFTRSTKLRNPIVLAHVAERTTFPVTELERFADCSSAWFFERYIDPRTIDGDIDAKMKGIVAHNALFKFFSGLPKELGTDRVPPEQTEAAVSFMRRCLETAVEGVRMEMTPMQRLELQQTLWRDLEQLVRDEAASETPLVPRRFEVSFGSERSAQELQRGIELGEGISLSGKIDRIDVDPFSARGIVQDYKTGKGAHSARQIDEELRLQIPLYMLVLRDLVGIEPLGGVYRPLAGERKARGLLRESARDDGVAGFAKNDYLAEDEFWQQVESAKARALDYAQRIRGGDVRHDPKGDGCPAWCDLWTMCRIKRA